MRISDWSSDVCSSDLYRLRATAGFDRVVTSGSRGANLDLRRPPGGRTTVFGRTGLRPRLLCTPGGFGARAFVMHEILRSRQPAMRGRPSSRLSSEERRVGIAWGRTV